MWKILVKGHWQAIRWILRYILGTSELEVHSIVYNYSVNHKSKIHDNFRGCKRENVA